MEEQDVVVGFFIVLSYDTRRCILRAFGACIDHVIGLNGQGIDLEKSHGFRSGQTNLNRSSNCCLVASS